MSSFTRPPTPAAVLGWVAIAADTLDAAKGQYEAVKDDTDLQEPFHEAGRNLQLVHQALEGANPDAERITQDTTTAIRGCNTKAEALRDMLEAVAQDPEASRAEAYKVAVKQGSKGRTIEVLVLGVMADVCGLSKDLAIQEKVEEMQAAMERLSKMESSLPKDKLGGGGHNHYGSGSQFIAHGVQNVSKGSGNHFPGASFYAPTTFNAPPS